MGSAGRGTVVFFTRSTGIAAGATGRAGDAARRVSRTLAGGFFGFAARAPDAAGALVVDSDGAGRLLLATHQ